MATNSKFLEGPSPNWPRPGGAMSEEEYHELERLSPDRKYEYIAGMAYMMSGGSVAHDRITRNLSAALDTRLSGPCTAFGVDVQVLVGTRKNGKKHYMYPDATVSYNPGDSRPENTLIEAPKVVIEVLSPGTEMRDRGVKFKAYQQCPTIQEVVLVSQFAQYVEIWQRDQQNIEVWHYRHYSPGETVELASIGVHVKIEELYRGLDFTQQEIDDEE
ncbi:MAG TPA: Uma2 family endonuclease [Ktedonobacteraceae bacterium]|nr:Uma2 family endonuclease [Ktedonobacteraceae bacterium]